MTDPNRSPVRSPVGEHRHRWLLPEGIGCVCDEPGCNATLSQSEAEDKLARPAGDDDLRAVLALSTLREAGDKGDDWCVCSHCKERLGADGYPDHAKHHPVCPVGALATALERLVALRRERVAYYRALTTEGAEVVQRVTRIVLDTREDITDTMADFLSARQSLEARGGGNVADYTPETLLKALDGYAKNVDTWAEEGAVNDPDILRHVEAWRAAQRRLELWREAVTWVREHYPEDIFPPDSQTPDAKAARMGRLTCDNIVRHYEEELAALAQEQPAAGASES